MVRHSVRLIVRGGLIAAFSAGLAVVSAQAQQGDSFSVQTGPEGSCGPEVAEELRKMEVAASWEFTQESNKCQLQDESGKTWTDEGCLNAAKENYEKKHQAVAAQYLENAQRCAAETQQPWSGMVADNPPERRFTKTPGLETESILGKKRFKKTRPEEPSQPPPPSRSEAAPEPPQSEAAPKPPFSSPGPNPQPEQSQQQPSDTIWYPGQPSQPSKAGLAVDTTGSQTPQPNLNPKAGPLTGYTAEKRSLNPPGGIPLPRPTLPPPYVMKNGTITEIGSPSPGHGWLSAELSGGHKFKGVWSVPDDIKDALKGGKPVPVNALMQNYKTGLIDGRAVGAFYQDSAGRLHFHGTIFSTVGSDVVPVYQGDRAFGPGRGKMEKSGNIIKSYE